MMFGSVFYNCWAALISFTIYFLIAIINPFAMPISTLIIASIVAIVGFLLMFPVRYLMGYVFYTPKEVAFNEETASHTDETTTIGQPLTEQKSTSTVEFADESTEDIAQVVRTMMSKDDDIMLSR
ncbi:multidrug transporter [Solibacillus sp. CAU 1738]|uniref:multidrug transporter n=1 Tax=Solibacillus sp. CAU 1738 TaxID=3140363 RepID=UPI003260BA0A